MKFSVIAGSTNYPEINKEIAKAASKYFDTSIVSPIPNLRAVVSKNKSSVFFEDKNLCEFDAVYPRTSLEDVIYGPMILDILIDQGVYSPVQPEAITIAKSKFFTLKVLSGAGLPTPKATLITSPETVESATKELNFPVVVKIMSGMAGKGVMIASSKKDFVPIIDTMARLKQPVSVEEYIENPGEDYRLFVIGNEVAASMKRKAKREGEFRANISIGGEPEKYTASAEEKEMAVKAAKAIGLDIAGVDIIHGPDGPVIIEVNDGPGLTGISSLSGVNLFEKVSKFIYEQAKK